MAKIIKFPDNKKKKTRALFKVTGVQDNKGDLGYILTPLSNDVSTDDVQLTLANVMYDLSLYDGDPLGICSSIESIIDSLCGEPRSVT